MLIRVDPPTMTGPVGTVDTTVKVDLLPMSAMLGTMMSVSAIRGLPIRPFRNTSSIPSSNWILLFSGMLGANTTLSARTGRHLRTVTFSSTLTPALVLVSPSMQIIPFPSSSGEHLKTFATTVLLPIISMVSPSSSPRERLETVSILARP